MSARVLLVDDEEAIRSSLGPFLARAGLEVHTASDGEEALEIAARLRPELIVCDVLMPKLDGRSVVRRLRDAGDWTPVILLTQVGESYERSAALEEGADDYLNKPFDPAELLARIRAVLRRAVPGVPSLPAATVVASGGAADGPRGTAGVRRRAGDRSHSTRLTAVGLPHDAPGRAALA